MKKSELKNLIKSIVTEVKKVREASYDDYDPNDFDGDPKPRFGGTGKHEKGGPMLPDEDPNLFAGDEETMPTGKHPGASVDENKKLGASTMKKSSDKKDNTQMGYEDKSITSTDKPTDKKEGKKLPIVQKKSNTQKDHSINNKSTPSVPSGEKKEGKALPVGGHGAKGLKEEIVQMIRESINEMAKTPITLDSSGIVRGGVPVQYRVQDKNSVTGWSLKGYTQRFPDGTPVEAPKNTGANYKKVSDNPNMGRPPAAGKTAAGDFDTSITATKRTEEAVEEFIKYNPEASEKEVTDVVAEKNTDETPHNLSPDAIKKAISKAKADSSSMDVEPTEKDIASVSTKNSNSNAYSRLRDRLLKAKMKPKT